MRRRALAPVDTALSRRITKLRLAHARLFDVDVDRRKRIDDAIDYFGIRRGGVAGEGIAPRRKRGGVLLK